MPRVLVVIGIALLVVSAGCSVRQKTQTERPLPERPDQITNASALDYAVAFEKAYAWNERRDEGQEVTVGSVNASILNRTARGVMVHVELTVGHEGNLKSGLESLTANYYVTASKTMRAATNGHVWPGPDPRNGSVVAG